MTSEESTEPMKEMMQKAAAQFQEKWDIDNNTKFEGRSDSSKNTKVDDKWNANKNSGTSSQKKNAVLKEILHDVVGALSEKWDSQPEEKQRTEKGDGSAEKGGKEDEQKNLEGNSSSSHSATSGSPSGDSPYVQAPVPTSQFEWTVPAQIQ